MTHLNPQHTIDPFERLVVDTIELLTSVSLNDPPRQLGERARIEYFVAYPNPGSSALINQAHSTLAHLMGILAALDGKPERGGWNAYPGLIDALRDPGVDWEETARYETEYFTLSWEHSNSDRSVGSRAEIVFKRPELVERMNNILRKHVPDALAPDGEK
jgi:hypothetical protein